MKKIALLLAIVSLSLAAMGQSATVTQNYIKTKTYTAENNETYVVDVEYYDGLGYPIQSVSVGASNNGMRSIVTPVYYDAKRRESRKYLPYIPAFNTGSAYQSSAISAQEIYYDNKFSGNNGYSYTENVYEASPLNRVLETYNVGNVFRTEDKKSTFAYEANSVDDEVLRFTVNWDTKNLEQSEFYNANSLYKNTMTNEDGSTVETYKDFLDRVVLERIVDDTDNNAKYDTYYVYDNVGNLCYVLPPKLSDMIISEEQTDLSDSDTCIKELAYIYKYDGHNRCIKKCLPGADPIYMIYDRGDRLVMTQDGNMHENNEWSYTEYDAMNRPVRQSILTSNPAVDPTTLQNNFNSATVSAPYNPLAIGSGFVEKTVLSETIYDAYVYEEEPATEDNMTMDRIPVGTNIRGWTFEITDIDIDPVVLIDDIRSIYINDEEWITINHYDGDNVNIYCYGDILAYDDEFGYDGGWSISEGYTFTIKNDQDYIVTDNYLPSSNETVWGFDKIVKVEE
jgi:hypothetical protein